jgi:hypothetical protein
MVDQSDILYGFFWRYLNLSMLSDEKRGDPPIFPGYGRDGAGGWGGKKRSIEEMTRTLPSF